MAHTNENAQHALRIMSRTPLIDGHNDWANTIRGYYRNKLDHRFDEEHKLIGHVDIGRLLAGRSGGVFLSAYVDCPKDEDDVSDESHFETLRDTLQQIDLIHRLVERYGKHLQMVEKSSDIVDVFRQGQIAVILSIEGLHQIANSPSILRNYYRLGVRCATLAHNKRNKFAGSSTSKAQYGGGLTNEGQDIVREMNRLGMMIDLSHVDEETVMNVLDLSTAPVVFTHSSCAALVPHPRNVTQMVLHHLKNNRGLVMISLIPGLTSQAPPTATITQVVDHIKYVGESIGYDHVAIGSDYDGMPDTIIGLEDVSKFPALVEEMLARRIKPAHVEKIIGKNIIRVLGEVEEESIKLKRGGHAKALEDAVKPLWGPELLEWCRKQWPDAQH